ncbi:trehalase-like domain-containing protein [Amycolatopsis decaplanina]|uniref:Glycoside hydrolase 15-like protein n=1 Tax=Amycolatopsis decaplanina DSM 44594 TaxID=1284240 RepID=M2YZY6_9PSEU|nr:trehalase-like domain-containing protein [Amycolatopsis decaplanina]EME54233.1 glycoside hydrolase 15-like protein [Amycolatopsis decaplanina DSM 44594]
MDRPSVIADDGLIGDSRTAALVSTDGAIDWFRCPRFDSPSVFATLLDPGGGHCRLLPSQSRRRAVHVMRPVSEPHATPTTG